MIVMEITYIQVLTIAASLGGSFSAVASLGWWLSGQFRQVEKKTEETIGRHEVVDQNRHEQNLAEFQKIYVALARVGANGDRSA